MRVKSYWTCPESGVTVNFEKVIAICKYRGSDDTHVTVYYQGGLEALEAGFIMPNIPAKLGTGRNEFGVFQKVELDQEQLNKFECSMGLLEAFATYMETKAIHLSEQDYADFLAWQERNRKLMDAF